MRRINSSFDGVSFEVLGICAKCHGSIEEEGFTKDVTTEQSFEEKVRIPPLDKVKQSFNATRITSERLQGMRKPRGVCGNSKKCEVVSQRAEVRMRLREKEGHVVRTPVVRSRASDWVLLVEKSQGEF